MRLKCNYIKGLLFFLLISLFLFLEGCKKIELFVSTDGNDGNPGTEMAPFHSLEKAKESVRLLLKEKPNQSIVVRIKGGVYEVETPIVFTSEDSGSEKFPVRYTSAEGEEPIFTGSKSLKNWKVLTDRTKLDLLDPLVRGKVYVLNLKEARIADMGDPTKLGARPELFCNGQLQTLARWPNKGFIKAGLVKGETKLPMTYIKKRATKEGVFEYLDKRQNRWKVENDVRVGGYWRWDFLDEFHKVGKVDTLSKTLYLSEPYHRFGYRDSLKYFGLNLFCEIDEPGEWYLDRSDGLLYWFPPDSINPEKDNVTFSTYSSPFMFEMKNCSNLILHGLTFREGRGSAIMISEGKNCLISDCRIERFGIDGIHIIEGTGHGISGCLLRTFGCGGIKIKGGDRRNLIPANHFVENTVIEYFSLFKRTYAPAIFMEGCGSRISNNRFRFSSSSAMRLEGNDFTVEYNEISHVVNESDDQGGIDMWYNPSYRGNVIRFNRWSDISGGTWSGATGVRLDDMISGVNIFGNIFERCGSRDFGGVQINGGKDNIIENNLFYQCQAAVSFSCWGENHWLEQMDSPVIKKKIFEEVDIQSDLYQKKYPDLKNIRLNVDVNTTRNNLLVDCTSPFLRKNDKQIVENNSSIRSEGKTIEEFCIPELLKKYGMQPIPIREIGPRHNKWLK